MLKQHHIPLAIFHWYTGPTATLQDISDAGYYFSINTAMIRAEKGRQLIARIPRERVLTETDGPFVLLGEVPAEPASVATVLTYLAQAWGMSLPKVTAQIKANFSQLLNGLRAS